MRAVVLHEHGDVDKLLYEEIEQLPLAPGDVRVKVGVTALNALDVFTRQGLPGVKLPLPHILGGDVAGWVEEAADEAGAELVGRPVLVDPLCTDYRGWKLGVFGEQHWGGLAESMVAPAANCIPLDGVDAVGLRPFAALPIAYGTAHHMIHARGGLAEGETMVVLGAAGGVGVACIQLGKQAGARVVACSTSDEKLELLRKLGADEVVNTATEPFARKVWEITGKRGADVVVDYIGRDTFNDSIRAARVSDLVHPGGRILTCGASSGFETTIDMRFVWTKEVDVRGSNGWRRPELSALVDMVKSGGLEPVIDAVFPLTRARDAVSALEQRTVLGKVLVVPDDVLEQAGA
jgi:NADPH:quinone reductase-like Zn-dependent oxidoreductase